jgi:hypothetical protein
VATEEDSWGASPVRVVIVSRAMHRSGFAAHDFDATQFQVRIPIEFGSTFFTVFWS